MKTKLLIILSLVSSLAMQGQTLSSSSKTEKTKKFLVVYYSRTGNTQRLAEMIQKTLNADVYVIKPVKPYPLDYKEAVEQVKQEKENHYRPPIQGKMENLSQYDVILVGSPNWWNSIAPPVATFLSTHNLNGKIILPFLTHEGTWTGEAEQEMKKLCPKSSVKRALAIRGTSLGRAQGEIDRWLAETMLK